MREKADYRANMEAINLSFPDRYDLSISDVARFTGHDRKAIEKEWGKEFRPFGKSRYITKARLATLLSQ